MHKIEAIVSCGVFLVALVAGMTLFGDSGRSEDEVKRQAFLVSHFHYDPVWTISQAGETFRAFSIIHQDLEIAGADPRFKFVLSELDSILPYWKAYPAKRREILGLAAAGRIEFTGGYSEPDEAAVGGEALIRNFIYGVRVKESMFGAAVETVGQHDVFGHAVQTPQILLKTGHKNAQFQRGNLTDLPQDFMWLAPDGNSILTRQQDYGGAGGDVIALGRDRSKYPFTNNAVFMVGGDFSSPDRYMMKYTKNTKTYAVIAGTHKDFFNAERRDIRERGLVAPEISRDHTPLLPGCYSSRVDTKLANRWAETTLVDAEKFSAVASRFTGRYPHAALDRAWRQVLYGQHHDALTGSDSENANLDLLTTWREALSLATTERDLALSAIAGRVDTKKTAPRGGAPVVMFNSLNWERGGPQRVDVALPKPMNGFRVVDASGADVAFQLAEPASPPFTRADILLAARVPSMGYAVYYIVPADSMPRGASPIRKEGVSAENEFFRVKVDPARGGGIVGIYGKLENKEYIDASTGVGNEIFAVKENNRKVEGPWSIHATGQVWRSGDYPADRVWVEVGPVATRIIVEAAPQFADVKIFDGNDRQIDTKRQEVLCRRVQEIILYKNFRRIDFRAHLIDYKETDFMYKVGFPASVKGALPVFEERFAAIGREKNGEDFMFYDFWREPGVKRGREYPAYMWMDYTSPSRIEFTGRAGDTEASFALAIGEIVVPDDKPSMRNANLLAKAFARKGVTTTPTNDKKHRTNEYYGFRVTIGAGNNAYTARILAEAPAAAKAAFDAALKKDGVAFLFMQPEKSFTTTKNKRAIPVLIVEAADTKRLQAAVETLVAQLEKTGNLSFPRVVDATGLNAVVEPYGVALINRGHVGGSVENDGTLTMTLLRSSTGWPSGKLYSRNLEVENWNHVYEYGLLPHPGDWRSAKLWRAGLEFNHPVYAVAEGQHKGPLPASKSFLSTPDSDAVVAAMKVAGFPYADGASANDDIVVRLYDPSGFAQRGEVKFFEPISAASKTDMLERGGKAVEKTKAGFKIAAQPFAIETYRVKSATVKKLADESRVHLPGPLFTRYWETNEGAAPIPDGPTVVIEPGAYSPDRRSMKVKITAAADSKSGGRRVVRLIVPPGAKAEPPTFEFMPDPADIHKPILFESVVSGFDLAKLQNQFIAARIESSGAAASEDYLTFRSWKYFEGEAPGADQPGFDDSTWEFLPLARFWSQGASAAVSWYRAKFFIPEGMGDKQMFFERPPGADITVYINGERVQKSADGYNVEPLIHPTVKEGAENLVVVRVGAGSAGGMWGTAFHGSEPLFNNNVWRVDTPRLRVKRGGRAALKVTFRNPYDQPVDGRAILASPVETWSEGGPFRLIDIVPFAAAFHSEARAETPVSFDVVVPAFADPGPHIAVVKFIYAGIAAYTAPIDIIVEP